MYFLRGSFTNDRDDFARVAIPLDDGLGVAIVESEAVGNGGRVVVRSANGDAVAVSAGRCLDVPDGCRRRGAAAGANPPAVQAVEQRAEGGSVDCPVTGARRIGEIDGESWWESARMYRDFAPRGVDLGLTRPA